MFFGSSNYLPGENGFHKRDGSLLKKKKKQWEKEKAESFSWFPFGKSNTSKKIQLKSTDLLNNKETHKEADSKNNNINNVKNTKEFTKITSTSSSYYSSMNTLPIMQPTTSNNVNTISPNMGCVMYAATTPNANLPLYPMFPTFPSASLYHPCYPNAYNSNILPNIDVIDNNISTGMNLYAPQNFISYQMQKSQNDNMNWRYNQQQNYNFIINKSDSSPVESNNSNSESLPLSNTNENIKTYDYNFSLTKPELNDENLKEKSNFNNEDALTKQLEDQKRYQELVLEQERAEIQRLKEIHAELERRHAEETAEEEKKKKQREETLSANEKSYLENIEKAKIESEALRKAKLFKHVIFDFETTDEAIYRILGTNNRELVNKVLKEVGALERQRRIEMENLSNSGLTPHSSERTNSSKVELVKSNGSTKNNISLNEKMNKKQTTEQLKQSVNKTPLSRNGFVQASLRINNSTKHKLPSSFVKRRSESMEKLNNDDSICNEKKLLTHNLNGSINKKNNELLKQDVKCSKNKQNLSHQQIKKNCNYLQKNLNLVKQNNAEKSFQNNEKSIRTKESLSPQFLRNLNNSSIQSKKTLLTNSSTSVNSHGTITIENSQFIKNLPHILNKKDNQANENFELNKLQNNLLQNNSDSEKKNMNNSFLQNKEYNQMNDKSDEFQNESQDKTDKQFDNKTNHFNFNQCSNSYALKHYESIVSKLSPITYVPTNQNFSRLAAASHNKALRCLTELSAQTHNHLTESASVNYHKQLGLFEPVKTRQRMHHDNCSNNDKHFNLLNHKNDIDTEHNDDDDDNARIVKGSSNGASSIATASDSPQSSPISTSPPILNNDMKFKNNLNFDTVLANSLNERYKKNNFILTNQENTTKIRQFKTTPFNLDKNLANNNTKNFFNSENRQLPTTPFSQKLAETGSIRQLSHINETELCKRNFYSPTIMRLRDSMNNLNLSTDECNFLSTKNNESQSRPMTPKSFNYKTTQYCSLNLKKNPERQQKILDQLANVRAQLKNRQEEIKKSFSVKNLSNDLKTQN